MYQDVEMIMGLVAELSPCLGSPRYSSDHIVGAVRASYIVFGSDSSKSTIFVIYVA